MFGNKPIALIASVTEFIYYLVAFGFYELNIRQQSFWLNCGPSEVTVTVLSCSNFEMSEKKLHQAFEIYHHLYQALEHSPFNWDPLGQKFTTKRSKIKHICYIVDSAIMLGFCALVVLVLLLRQLFLSPGKNPIPPGNVIVLIILGTVIYYTLLVLLASTHYGDEFASSWNALQIFSTGPANGKLIF